MALTKDDLHQIKRVAAEVVEHVTTPKFKAIDQRFDNTDHRLNKMDQRFDGIDRRLDKMDKRFDGIDQRFDGVDQRFDSVDERFDGVDQAIYGLKTEVTQLTVKFESFDSKLDAIAELVTTTVQTRQDTQELKARVDKLEHTTGSLQPTVALHSRQIAELRRQQKPRNRSS